MRATIGLVAALSATTAWAQAPKCTRGSADILRLIDWSAKAEQAAYGAATEVRLTFENVSGKQLRMVEASATFTDSLGGMIGAVGIDRDTRLPPGTQASKTARYPGALPRLPTLEKRDVTAVICASAVIFEDGEKREFK